MQKIDTIILLVGGKGTRLGEKTKNCPKPLLEFFGKPFLAWKCEILSQQGIKHFIFSTGYLASQFSDFEKKHLPAGCTLQIFEEKTPLGTGGGLLMAIDAAKNLGRCFWAGNGDSFWNVDLMGEMQRVHSDQKAQMTILCTKRKRPDQSGVVLKESQIVEWDRRGAEFINAGLYLFDVEFFNDFKKFVGNKKSLEKDMLPTKILNEKIMGVIDSSDLFLDFGTPEFYDGVESFLGNYFPELKKQ